MRMNRVMAVLGLILLLVAPSISSAASVAVWLDGALSASGNAIPSRINTALGAGTATLVTTALLATPGFLSPFDAVVLSRSDAGFGSFLSAAAATAVATYVGSGASQGGVAVFTNDLADNLLGSSSGDPFDANLDRLFVNALTFAVASHHGFIGEFNGAVMAMASNTAGAPALGLLTGSANGVHFASGVPGGHFVYDVGPIGAGNPIDAGITFPFTDADTSIFRTDITGADPNNIVDIFDDNKLPAVLANQFVISGGQVPEPGTWLLFGTGIVGLLGYGWRQRKKAA